MKLSYRLTCIRQHFDQDSTSIWDVGCDHGLLGLSFLNDPQISGLHLVDPSQQVIEVLKKKLLDSYITIPKKIKIHHQKGQDLKLSSERKTIFIAGMGGKEIREILEALGPQLLSTDRVVISPHRKVLELRQWLASGHWGLIDEEIILEDGQFYPILVLVRDEKLLKVSPYGQKQWQTPIGQLYLQHQLKHFERHEDEASQRYISFLRSLSS